MANEWNKTALVGEFETMLRRHLRSGAAPVAACAGFDLDAASAYLEGALDEWRRASYESHLAGCAICRRHLIELARLAQAAPSFEPQPVTVLDQAPAWVRWREVVTGWFDISSRKLKWQMAGATGAAFAILIAALGVQSWRQASNTAALRSIEASPSPPPAAEVAQTLTSPTPEPSTPDANKRSEELIANRSASSPASVPTPLVGPKGNAPEVPFAALGERLALSDSQPSEAPVAPTQSSGGAKPSPPPQLGTRVAIDELKANARVPGGFSGPKEAEATALGPDVIPRLRPDLVEKRSEPPSKPQPKDPSLSRQALEAMRAMVKRSLSPIGKTGFTESEGKDISNTQVDSGDESPKLMVRRIRGKVFRFEKDTWVDQEYKPDMQEWRRWTLKRGSDQYKRVLADEPLLKEFFDLGPILIVWKNRIYKVLK